MGSNEFTAKLRRLMKAEGYPDENMKIPFSEKMRQRLREAIDAS
jgi:hypothetical protein